MDIPSDRFPHVFILMRKKFTQNKKDFFQFQLCDKKTIKFKRETMLITKKLIDLQILIGSLISYLHQEGMENII